MSLTFKEVAEILSLIDASDCNEVVLELGGARLVVRNSAEASAAADFSPQPGVKPRILTANETPVSTSETPAGAASVSVEPPEIVSAIVAEGELTDVRAPMMGTFYRRPSPSEPLFVEEGAIVKKGDPLCLIEVMKLFTTIEAPADGTVVAIATEDGELAEFNQLLMRIRV